MKKFGRGRKMRYFCEALFYNEGRSHFYETDSMLGGRTADRTDNDGTDCNSCGATSHHEEEFHTRRPHAGRFYVLESATQVHVLHMVGRSACGIDCG